MPEIFYDILDGEVDVEDGDSYGSQAEFYDALNEGTDDYEMQEQVLRDYIPEGSKVLYLGNGSGNLTDRIDNDYDIVGLDMSQEMLDISREKTEAGHVQGDIRQLPIQEDSFDAVIMLGRTMTYLTEDDEVDAMMSEVNDVLKEDGVFLFDNFREDTGDPQKERLGGHGQYHFGRVMVEMDDEVSDYDPENHSWTWDVEYTLFDRSTREEVRFEDTQRHRGFAPEELQDWLTDNGFTDIEMEGRHAERKEVEDGDNEIITKAGVK